MQNRTHSTNPHLLDLRVALREAMRVRGHTQLDVSRLTGMPQSQISRFLRGGGKRLTPHLSALCTYADFDPETHSMGADANSELSQLLREVIGDNAAAAQALLVVVKALAPALQHMPDQRAKERRAR